VITTSTARQDTTELFHRPGLQEVGEISLEGAALRMVYLTREGEIVAYIEAGGLLCIAKDRWTLPVPVYRRHEEPDGPMVRQKIGHAARSVSGRFLKVSTTDSSGDLMICWSAFLLVVRREAARAMIRRSEVRGA